MLVDFFFYFFNVMVICSNCRKLRSKRASLYTICMWLARWKINVNTSALTGRYQHFTEPTITVTENLLELRGKYTPYICWSFSLNGDKDMDHILRKHVVSKELFQKLHFLLEMTLITKRQSLDLVAWQKKKNDRNTYLFPEVI